jgi:CRISPR-associated protein Cas1
VAAWRILDFSGFEGKLSYQRGQIVVRPVDADQATVSLADVAVILVGLKAALGGALLHQCAKFDVVVLICDWRGVPVAGSYPWSEHTRVGARHLAQAHLSKPRRKNAWGRIVQAKIRGQQANLKALKRPSARSLGPLADSVRSGDPDNSEARAAKAYWPQLFGDRSFSRQPGLGRGENGLLDYGYMVLRGFAVRAVLESGLIGSLGLFHRGRSNAFNLADDLIEPFRPAVDWCVVNLPENSSPNHPAVKQALVAASTGPFTADGYSAATGLRALAQQYGNYVEGNVEKLSPPAWRPPSHLDHG